MYFRSGIKKRVYIFLVAACYNSGGFAADDPILRALFKLSARQGTITEHADREYRCPNRVFVGEKCEEVRREALANGCIQQADYNDLKNDNRFPHCEDGQYVEKCNCGCFAEDTSISVELPVLGRYTMLVQDLAHSSTPINVTAPLIVNYTPVGADILFSRARVIRNSVGEEEGHIVRIHLSTGKALRVTEAHPILVKPGKMIQARQLSNGDMLLDREGRWVSVLSIQRDPYSGKVFNFEVGAPSQNLLVSEGVLVGDLKEQDMLDQELTNVEVRNQD